MHLTNCQELLNQLTAIKDAIKINYEIIEKINQQNKNDKSKQEIDEATQQEINQLQLMLEQNENIINEYQNKIETLKNDNPNQKNEIEFYQNLINSSTNDVLKIQERINLLKKNKDTNNCCQEIKEKLTELINIEKNETEKNIFQLKDCQEKKTELEAQLKDYQEKTAALKTQLKDYQEKNKKTKANEGQWIPGEYKWMPIGSKMPENWVKIKLGKGFTLVEGNEEGKTTGSVSKHNHKFANNNYVWSNASNKSQAYIADRDGGNQGQKLMPFLNRINDFKLINETSDSGKGISNSDNNFAAGIFAELWQYQKGNYDSLT